MYSLPFLYLHGSHFPEVILNEKRSRPVDAVKEIIRIKHLHLAGYLPSRPLPAATISTRPVSAPLKDRGTTGKRVTNNCSVSYVRFIKSEIRQAPASPALSQQSLSKHRSRKDIFTWQVSQLEQISAERFSSPSVSFDIREYL